MIKKRMKHGINYWATDQTYNIWNPKHACFSLLAEIDVIVSNHFLLLEQKLLHKTNIQKIQIKYRVMKTLLCDFFISGEFVPLASTI